VRSNCLKIYEYFRNNFKNENTIEKKPKKDVVKKKTLFTSYLCDKGDEIVRSILNDWQSLNPNYNILYFSDKDIESFFKESEYYDIYRVMKNGVAIADFFRICYINKYGGYWFDLDLEPIVVDIPDTGKIHLFDAGYKNISYMFIGGSPNQKLFKDTINDVVRNIIANKDFMRASVLDITGPRVIQNILCKRLNIVNKDGCLPSKEVGSKVYLKDTEYEFVYKRIKFSKTKTERYKQLQKKYNKKPYYQYDYV